jgi:excinuclease UvrABC nuclease subunit
MHSLQEVLDLPSVSFMSLGRLPIVGGVYFVVAPDAPRLRYVGQAQNLRRRWERHHRVIQMNPEYAVYWLVCEDAVGRDQLERDAINRHTPPWNRLTTEGCIKALTWELWHAQLEIRALRADLCELQRSWHALAEDYARLQTERNSEDP